MHLESWPRSIQGGNRTSLIKIGGKGATSGRHSDIVTFNSVLQQHTCRSGAEGNGAHSANGAHIMYEVECISASDCCGSSGTFFSCATHSARRVSWPGAQHWTHTRNRNNPAQPHSRRRYRFRATRIFPRERPRYKDSLPEEAIAATNHHHHYHYHYHRHHDPSRRHTVRQPAIRPPV